MSEQKLLSTQNKDDGFVDVEVEHIDCTKEVVRISAVSRRQRAKIHAEWVTAGFDPEPVIRAGLRESHDGAALEHFLDRLTESSVEKLFNYSFAMMFGE